MTVVDRFVQAVSHGGAMIPTLQVVHSAETPLKAGYAKSIAENWFGRSATTSAHFMGDPVELIRMLSDNVVAYAVGPKANDFTLNWEQAGYARFTRAEWTTPDGHKQIARLGAGLRERGLANRIPLRWASDDDIRAAARGVPGGICFHDDIRRVLGGTTHSDPMPDYPRDLLEQAWAAPDTAPVQEDTNMTVIQPNGEAIVIKGVGHKRLRVACDFDWQQIRLAFNTRGGWSGWPGTKDFVLPVAASKVSYLDLPAETDFISVKHLGKGEGARAEHPVTVDTCP